MSNALAVTSENFTTEVLQSPLPVLVDFWAAWCGPCRAVAPTVEALASEYAGKLKVVKLDVDESGDVAGQFGVQSIPTLILFKGGQPVERLVGNVPKPAIVSKIQQYLS
jgi:thioredoxin 1